MKQERELLPGITVLQGGEHVKSAVLLCQGTALALPLRDASVHCVVTSPPYYGLRSYGIGEGELGLEPTLAAYVEAMVQVFREVKRVLRADGTLWLNLGDVYSSGNRGSFGPLTGKNVAVKVAPRMAQPPALPEKSLLGLPWRVALALQADGWTLRAEIIWHKVNPMPESVQDRPTRAHEQVFLLSKQGKYYYDGEAVREPLAGNAHSRGQGTVPKAAEPGSGIRANTSFYAAMPGYGDQTHGRNARTIWRIPSEPFSGSHFATFPTALVRRCLLAGAPTQVCAACGAPWRREVERECDRTGDREARGKALSSPRHDGNAWNEHGGRGFHPAIMHVTGFSPTYTCAAGTQPATVLDPFCGSGTTLLVARELGHHAVGIDLSYPYLHDIARERLGLAALARWAGTGPPPTPAVSYDDLPLFAGG